MCRLVQCCLLSKCACFSVLSPSKHPAAQNNLWPGAFQGVAHFAAAAGGGGDDLLLSLMANQLAAHLQALPQAYEHGAHVRPLLPELFVLLPEHPACLSMPPNGYGAWRG